MSTAAFWVDMADEVEVALRRMVLSDRDKSKPPCPSGYHEAKMPVGRMPTLLSDDGRHQSRSADEFEDGPWPTHCGWGCGYEFTDDDTRQVWEERIFRRPDTGEEWTERRLPPGAMLDGVWHVQKGPDGVALVVVLPPAAEDTRGHWWHVDGPSRNNGVPGPGWSRTGDPKAVPPTVVASPSILTDAYHGFLQLEDGRTVLTDHLG